VIRPRELERGGVALRVDNEGYIENAGKVFDGGDEAKPAKWLLGLRRAISKTDRRGRFNFRRRMKG